MAAPKTTTTTTKSNPVKAVTAQSKAGAAEVTAVVTGGGAVYNPNAATGLTDDVAQRMVMFEGENQYLAAVSPLYADTTYDRDQYGSYEVEGRREVTFATALNQIYGVSEDQLRKIQAQLEAAGFYDEVAADYSSGKREVSYGQLDEDTMRAYKLALTQAVRSHQSGQSLEQMLTSRIKVQQTKVADRQFTEMTDTINTISKADVDSTVDNITKELLGRRLDDGDPMRAKVLGLIQGKQIAAGTKGATVARDNRLAAFNADGAQASVADTDGDGTVSSSEQAFKTNLDKLVAAARAEGLVITRSPNYGKRTHEQQARLYQEKPNLAAKPGSSNHEFGLADDLQFGSEKAKEWAHDHAEEFGLTFPMIRGRSKKNEPWHVELVDAKAQRNISDYSPPTPGVPAPAGSAPPTVAIEGVDPGAEAEQTIRKTMNTEVQAHNLGNVWEDFVSIIGGGGVNG